MFMLFNFSNNILEFVPDGEDDGFDNNFLPTVGDAEGDVDLNGFPDINMPGGEPLEGNDDEVDDQIYGNLEDNQYDPLAELPLNDSDDEFGDDGMGQLYESIKRIVETKLNDFGKHPAYQKVVMSLPKNADGSQWGEDWNDESAKGEEPYGKQIGDSAPFNDVVSAITNAVVTALSSKKKD